MGNSQSFVDGFKYHTSISKGDATYSDVYRAASHPGGLLDNMADSPYTNTFSIFDYTVRRSGNRKAFGRRTRYDDGSLGEYEWMTYAEAQQIALAFGSVLHAEKFCPLTSYPEEQLESCKELKVMGIYAKNCIEWFLCEQACNAYGITICPLYDTLGDEAVELILQQTSMESMLLGFDSIQTLVKVVVNKAENGAPVKNPNVCLKRVVLVNPKNPNRPSESVRANAVLIDQLRSVGITVELWHEVISRATNVPICPAPMSSPQTLCYTSGTTGLPKAVIITHEMIVAVVAGSVRGPVAASGVFNIVSTDVICSYLPLAHVFERCVCQILMAKGGAIGVFSGDMGTLLDDIKILRPTVFVSVPRLFNRINDRVGLSITEKSSIVRMLFDMGISSKVSKRRSESATTHKVWDPIVFGKIRQMMGGRVRGMISGGAPLDPIVNEKMTAFFSCPVAQGYGLSESFGPCFLMHVDDPSAGYIGGVWPSVEFKLMSIPEMQYTVSQTDASGKWIRTEQGNVKPVQGELLLRGPGVAPGYFQLEAEGTWDSDGWFHTGDVAELHPQTLAVKIIDRKKNIFKLSQGEYVAPEKIEGVYLNCPSIAQVFIFGFSTETYLVALVYPDVDALKKVSKSNEITEICDDPNVLKYIMAEMESEAKYCGLKGFEKAKKIRLITDPFSIENDQLTPTSKLKRNQIKEAYSEAINQMYGITN